MPRTKITERAIAALPPLPADGPAQVIHWDTGLPGFGLVQGRKSMTFIMRRRIAGRQVKRTIGRHGDVRADGRKWTATFARQRATEIAGEMVSETEAPGTGKGRRITLRQGLALHVEHMRRKRRSPRSISTIENDVRRNLAEWLDRPLVELTGAKLDAICRDIMDRAKPRAGAVNPPGAAQCKRLVAQVSAIWNAADRLHELPGRNPARRVVTHALEPRGERVDNADLPAWFATVQTLAPVRRDLQMMALFTGLRSESVRHLRWDDVDLERRLLHVSRAKGDRPYTIPIAEAHVEIIERRRVENPILFSPHGGDGGWIFASLSRAQPFEVIPVAESKERRTDPATGKRENILPGLHALRRTYNSIAIEAGVSLDDRQRLMNHAGRGVNIKHYGFPQSWAHLAECQARIAAAIWARINGEVAP